MPSPGDSLIIVGASARAAAQSAIRAGLRPWCIDLFGDVDLRRDAPVRVCPPSEYPFGILALMEDAPAGAVMFTGAMENHLSVIDAIALDRPIAGPNPDAIRLARDPATLAALPAYPGLGVCRIRTSPPIWSNYALLRRAADRFGSTRWLVKPLDSAAGASIAPWDGQSFQPGQYLQQHIQGRPVSAIYATDGWSVRLVGATEQIIGDEAFGVTGFRYAGNIGPLPLDESQRDALAHLGAALAQQLDLRVLFGVDLILDDSGRFWPIEINPRYTASVELVERFTGSAVLADWPAPEGRQRRANASRYQPPPVARASHGKAIVFAKTAGRAPDVAALFEPHQVADIPVPGQPLRPGMPICTVFAAGPDHDTCRQRLRNHANIIHERMAGDNDSTSDA